MCFHTLGEGGGLGGVEKIHTFYFFFFEGFPYFPTHGQYERVLGIFAEQVVSSSASVFIQTDSGSAGR